MFDNPILQTAIGLIFVFLGFSLIASAVQEFIASIVGLRAITLRRGLCRILTQGQQGLDFYNKLMAHPVVAPLREKPSYISARQFSTAAMHIVTGAASAPATMASLKIAVLNLPDAPYKSVLVSLFRDGEDDFDRFEKRLQSWFDESMDRVSGIYKRYSQYFSFAIGFVLAILLRADTLAVAHSLWTEPYLRANVVSQAAATAHQQILPDIDKIAPSLALFHFGGPLSWAMLPGFLITAAAITMGAPFWFDLLKQFVNLRGTGPVPARADDKDP